MNGPQTFVLKRKRVETAPEALLVQRPGKRQTNKSISDGQDEQGEQQPVYVLQKGPADNTPTLFDADNVQRQADKQALNGGSVRGKAHASGNGHRSASSISKERRTYHLKRPSTPEAGIRKHKTKADGIATVIEKKKVKHTKEDLLDLAERRTASSATAQPTSQVLKRPGKGAAIRNNGQTSDKVQVPSTAQPSKTDPHLQDMADSLHKFALEEAAKEAAPKPKITSVPKLPPQRSLELHRQRASQPDAKMQDHQTDASTDAEDDSDYVYDTYVLAPTSGAGAAQIGAAGTFGNVGYLVITEEDQAIWETYLEDEPSEKDWESDEDDENAEDWYGADYPDDEIASDDEYGRNVYGYRARAGSDDEEWDADTGNFSDDEVASQPWRKKTPEQFAKYLD